MKDGIHPSYHTIKVVMTDGTEFETKSTYGKPGEKMTLSIDPKTHPAYTGVFKVLNTGGRVDRFKNKFGLQDKK